MKKFHISLLLALLVAPLTHADELQDAAAALNNKSYTDAVRLYAKAAAAGNPQAQLQLGEMYFYGEGVAVDEKAAAALFEKAAALGNQEAVANLTRIGQRHTRQAEIAYWTDKYDGADLRQGGLACAAPAIPEMSKTNAEIAKVSADFNTWRDCHNALLDQLSAVLPAGKQIPSDLELLMTDVQINRARTHLVQVYRQVGNERASVAHGVVARYQAWSHRTQVFVKMTNEQRLIDRKHQEEMMDSIASNYGRVDTVTARGPLGTFPGNHPH